MLIVPIIISESVEDHSLMNVSVIAPFMFAPNVLCLFYDGQLFTVILSKGSIGSFYSIGENLIDLNEIFDKVKLKEKVSIPDKMLILNDDLNQLVYLDLNQFIRLNDLDEIIPLEIDQWKIVIQYAKIIKKLDQLKYFVSTMKIYSNYSDLNRILKQFDFELFRKTKSIQQKLSLLKENSEEISRLEQQIDDISKKINEEKINYINDNRHLTPQYWNHILDLISQQLISSYLVKHFYFNQKLK